MSEAPEDEQLPLPPPAEVASTAADVRALRNLRASRGWKLLRAHGAAEERRLNELLLLTRPTPETLDKIARTQGEVAMLRKIFGGPGPGEPSFPDTLIETGERFLADAARRAGRAAAAAAGDEDDGGDQDEAPPLPGSEPGGRLRI